MIYMDGFDSNMKNDQFDQHSELPEGFGWDDMREGIYKKMQKTTKSKKNNRPWYLLLLLLLIIFGCGSWFALYLNERKSMTNPVLQTQKNEREINTDSENTPTNIKPDKQNDKAAPINDFLTQTNLNNKKTADTKKKVDDFLNVNNTKHRTNIPKIAVNNIVKENPKNTQNQLNTPTSREAFVYQPQKEKTTDDADINTARISPRASGTTDKLPSILTLIDHKTSDIIAFKTPGDTKPPAFRKHLSFGLAGGMMNWIAFDADNISHDFVSGFPGYNINPSISLSLTPNHALQVDYEYSSLEELFDYEGSRPIEVVREDQAVREVYSSLTGNLIYTERRDVSVSGTRHYRELKYNQYKLHVLSLGYRFDQITMKKSSFGFYTGASYLFQLNSKGKRLNEELDVITFDENNPLFEKNQLGLRFGIHYNYSLNANTKLFSQVLATKYMTNWELDNSNSATRPLLYGLQIGLRYYPTNK